MRHFRTTLTFAAGCLSTLLLWQSAIGARGEEESSAHDFVLLEEASHDLQSVQSIAFGRQGQSIWVQSFQGKISRVSLESGEVHSSFFLRDSLFEPPVQFSPSTETMVRLGDGFVEQIDLNSGRTLSYLPYKPYSGFAATNTTISEDGQYLLSTEPVGTAAEIVDRESGERLSVYDSSVLQTDLAGYLQGFNAPAVAAGSGRHVLSTFDTLYLFAKDGNILWKHTEPGIARMARFSGNGSRLATGPYKDQEAATREDGSGPEFLALRSVDDGRILERYDVEELHDFSFSSDGRLLLVRDRNKQRVRVWDLDRQRQVLAFEPDGKRIAAHEFSQDGMRLVLGVERGDGRAGSFAVFQQGGRKEQQQEAEEPELRLVTQSGHTGLVTNNAVSADGKLMASSDSDGVLWLWHLPTRRAIRSTSVAGKSVGDLLFLDESTVLFLASEVAYRWDVISGKISPFEPIERHEFNGFGIEKSGDLVWFWDLSSVTVYDTKNVKILIQEKSVYETFGTLIDTVEVAPSGREFAVVSGNRIHRFDAASGQSLGHLVAGDTEDLEIHDVHYSADSEHIYAAFEEKAEGYTRKPFLAGWHLTEPPGASGTEPFVQRDTGDTHLYSLWTRPSDGALIGAGGDQRYRVLDPDTVRILSEADWLPVGQRLSAAYGVTFTNVPGTTQAVVQSGGAIVQLSAFDYESGDWLGGFTTEVSIMNGVGFSRTGNHLYFTSGGSVHVWSLEEGREIKRLANASYNPGFDNIASDDRGILTLTQSMDKPAGQNAIDLRFWNPRSGDRVFGSFPTGFQNPQTGEFVLNSARKVQFSPDNAYMVMLGSSSLAVWKIKDGSVVLQAYDSFDALDPVVLFSGGERYLTLKLDKFDEDFSRLATWDLETGKELWRNELPIKLPGSIRYSRSGETIEVRDTDGGMVWLYDARDGRLTGKQDLRDLGMFVPIADASADLPDFVASTWLGHASLFDTAKPDSRVEFAGQAQIIAAAASHDGKWIATADAAGKVVLRDARTAEKKLQLSVRAALGDTIRFSPDDVLLAIVEENGGASLWDTFTGEKLVSLMSLSSLDGQTGWLTVSPDGRYDANDPGDVAALSWIRRDAPLHPLPVSVFYRDYYEPRLLPRLLALEALPEVRDIRDINIDVPDVTIKEVREQQRGVLSVTVAVGKGDPSLANGAFSLKLFRDRRLVGQYPDTTGGGSRLNSRIHTDKGQTLVTFSGIKTPASAHVDDIRSFSAYAFNADGVKGQRSTLNYQYKTETEVRDPRAYVLTIGVNSHQNASWDLKYAVADADAINAALVDMLRSGAEQTYKKVVPISLVASSEEGRPITATKAHIKAVIDALAGREPDQTLLKEIDGAADLQTANPEDLVILTYSGHGYADPRGAFHLFPWDIGAGNDRAVSSKLLSQSVSSEMLSDWLYPVDAGHTVIILDACNSAAVVETANFKPGPMNSRTLGQLAYDKGMQILTASQAENVALESSLIQHGLLTYALIKEGLENNEADYLPQDSKITLSEWLTYGTQRVPDLYRQVREGELAPISKGAITLDTIILVDNAETNVQSPSLFDFFRGATDPVLRQTSPVQK